MVTSPGTSPRELPRGTSPQAGMRLQALTCEGAALSTDRASLQNRVHLWIAFTGDVRDAGLLHCYEGLLSPEERARGQQLRFSKDKHRFLVTRALVRAVLAGYLAMRPEELTFKSNVYGRPELSHGKEAAPWLRFNLSHTASLVALAVTGSRALGVDVEARAGKQCLVSAGRHFLSRAEQQHLQGLPLETRLQKLLELWTLKEAYTKARGMGMSLPFNEVAFDLSRQSCITASCGAELQDEADRWRFFLLEASAGHIVSLCVDLGTRPNKKKIARRIVPLVSEAPCSLSLLRRSH